MSPFWSAVYGVLFEGYAGAVVLAVAVVAIHALLDYLDSKADDE